MVCGIMGISRKTWRESASARGPNWRRCWRSCGPCSAVISSRQPRKRCSGRGTRDWPGERGAMNYVLFWNCSLVRNHELKCCWCILHELFFCWLKWYWICIEIVKCVMSGRHQIKRGAMQSRKYIGEKSPGSLSPLLRLVGRHVHDACSVRPRRTLPLWRDNVTRVPEERWRWAQHVRTYTFDW